MLYAEVIVPLPLRGTFTYSVSDECKNSIKVGSRVIVQFGKKKFYTGIVSNLSNENKTNDSVKEIVSLLDDNPSVLQSQLQFWQWIAAYYMCSEGEVYKAALPSALKLESETYIFKNANFESDASFSPNETRIFDLLSDKKPLKISEIEKLTGINNIAPYVKTLSDKKAILLNENITKGYSAKTESVVSLAKAFTEDELNEQLNSLNRAKKQQELLSLYLFYKQESDDSDKFDITKKALLEKSSFSVSVLDGLVDKNILKYTDREVSRFNFNEADLQSAKLLNTYQQEAYEQINDIFVNNPKVLLHGVTGSGKTEIYIQLIKDTIESGKQVLYLLPEIALTTQITERLKNVFGDKLAIYHSKFNDSERAEVWQNLLTPSPKQVILGVRSSIFLPFQNLGLIIVDEEHETSYKQQDPAPRYNARDAAIYLSQIHKANILLGTATPSIETYYNASNGKYRLVSLTKRHEDIELPRIEVVNVKELRRTKQMKTVLSPILTENMQSSFARNEQTILFQNRRGFAPLIECKACAWIPKCQHCDVSLTYHKGQKILLCHYCGATYSVPERCPECKLEELEVLGYGTERIEEEVAEIFPDTKILRMDLDTTRSKMAYEKIINQFADNEADILIGTQMVSKGLDFDNVSIVGILNADGMLNYPEFRAYERAFQMMTQVSGRAGRKNKQGTVFLQTMQPNNPIIKFVCENNYTAFYEQQIEERKMFSYPPFYRLISVTLKHKDEALLHRKSIDFVNMLQQNFGDKVLGPTRPSVAWVQSLHIRKVLVKVAHTASPQKVRETLEYYKSYILNQPESKSILITFDVDPS